MLSLINSPQVFTSTTLRFDTFSSNQPFTLPFNNNSKIFFSRNMAPLICYIIFIIILEGDTDGVLLYSVSFSLGFSWLLWLRLQLQHDAEEDH